MVQNFTNQNRKHCVLMQDVPNHEHGGELQQLLWMSGYRKAATLQTLVVTIEVNTAISTVQLLERWNIFPNKMK